MKNAILFVANIKIHITYILSQYEYKQFQLFPEPHPRLPGVCTYSIHSTLMDMILLNTRKHVWNGKAADK